MKKNIFLLFLVVLFTLIFSSCSSQESVYPPKDHIKIELEPEYSIYDDILVDISIGLWKEAQESYISTPNLKYIVAYSKTYPADNSEEHTILFTLTDFSSDIYYFTENGNKIIYNFKETFSIKKEVFTDSTGEFYIFMYSTTSDFNGRSFTRISKITYEKNNETLILNRSKS
ncbi:MAG: hypothetical protein K2M08_00690 [Anaeroplasmataceae bacterium]|nr:hypothetical protein [Anaeroplasmataceae bacterium]